MLLFVPLPPLIKRKPAVIILQMLFVKQYLHKTQRIFKEKQLICKRCLLSHIFISTLFDPDCLRYKTQTCLKKISRVCRYVQGVCVIFYFSAEINSVT